MRFIRDLSIQRKIGCVILLTCGAALAVAAGAFLLIQLASFRQEFTGDLEAMGQVVAHGSAAPIHFQDRNAAEEILQAVQSKQYIVRASITLADGSEFAGFEKAKLPDLRAAKIADGVCSLDRYLVLQQPIWRDGARVATLRLVSDYHTARRDSLRPYATALGLMLLLSAALALLLSARLQRLISQPILELADTAQGVADQKNYSVRARKAGRDEVGRLTDAFNAMLAKIEREIEERKGTELELAGERDLLRSLLDNFPDAIYFKDTESRFVRFSNSFRRLFGVEDLEQIRGKTDADFFAPEHARPALEDEREIMRTGKPMIGKLERETRLDGHVTWALTSKMPWRNREGKIIGTFGISKDITSIKEAEAKVESLHKELILTSHQAGMAEVATGVLHNVGNVLNSINVSTLLMGDRLRNSRLANLGKALLLLREHRADLAGFLTGDPKGKLLPSYLETLADHLAAEQKEILAEMEGLAKNIEHIKEIVAMQQNYAKLCGITEDLTAAELVEDAIRMNLGAFERHSITLVREFQTAPPVSVDKHKVLQILVNLLRNAKYALDELGPPERRLTLRIARENEHCVAISVSDNGVGIAPENLTRIFSHGFTTRRNGHGFGLHSGVLAAREMGGELTAHSDGIGKGASFCLHLPVATVSEQGHEHEKGVHTTTSLAHS